jgi:hypothetical protein
VRFPAGGTCAVRTFPCECIALEDVLSRTSESAHSIQPSARMTGISRRERNAELDYAPHAGCTNWRYHLNIRSWAKYHGKFSGSQWPSPASAE